MKPNDNNLEKNISRLLKLTADSDKPSPAFTESLIDKAVSQLEQTHSDRPRAGRKIAMKLTLKTLAMAAVVLIVAGITFFSVSQFTQTRQTTQVALSDQPDKQTTVREYNESDRRKIEYTQKSAEPTEQIASSVKEAPVDQKRITVAKVDKDKLMKSSKPRYDLQSLGYITDQSKRAAEDIAAKNLRFLAEAEKTRVAGKGLSGLIRQPIMPASSEPPSRGYPMAHGGTTPPNGEDVDAQFFKNYGVNPFIDTEDDHLSTFATDVDTGSYTVCRRYLQEGHLPPSDAVRVEEFVNYFKYGYQPPQEDTFAVYSEAVPWTFGTGRKNSYLLRLGLKAQKISAENRKPAILTFVIDVSGSMNRENRLGLVKRSLRMLVDQLKPSDRIGIAVYGSRGRVVMPHKGLDQKTDILVAINSLVAEGSTYAEEGIRLGYEMAEKAYKQGHINRVILCSDGVANVGNTGADAILAHIRQKAEKGVTLSALGFGMGNYNDVLMEQLGDKGNGYYSYIDTIAEAKRLFADNLTGSLQVVARDVKIQVDFNSDVVRSYRLIGYENRDVPDNKFRDDKYDGGEVGAGHSVTALYEFKLWPEKTGTVATTYVRYKHPDTRKVTEFKTSIATQEFRKSFAEAGDKFKLAATVTELAEILRKSYWAKGATLDNVLQRAQNLGSEFRNNTDVIELIDLIAKAKQLQPTKDNDNTTKENTSTTDKHLDGEFSAKLTKAVRIATDIATKRGYSVENMNIETTVNGNEITVYFGPKTSQLGGDLTVKINTETGHIISAIGGK